MLIKAIANKWHRFWLVWHLDQLKKSSIESEAEYHQSKLLYHLDRM